MVKATGTLQLLREQQLSWGLKALSVAGFFMLGISLSRAFTFGWLWVMWLHISLYLLILGITILQRRFSFRIRAGLLVLIPLLLGASGLVSFGLAALGLQALFSFCIIATMLFGRRAGICAAGVSIVLTGLVGFLYISGILRFQFDPQTYLLSSTAWLSAMISLFIAVGLIVVALGTAHEEIENLVQALQHRNQEMAKVIQRLEIAVEEHTRLEEERHQLEVRVQRTKRIEDLGTLAGGVAHDLNNILAGAVTYPDFLLEQLPKDSPLREPLQTIRRSGIKAAAIVEDLLTLARRGLASFSVVSLNSVVSDYFGSLEFQRLKSYHPKVEIDMQLGPDSPNILGSPIHLLKTIMNLVSNAAEAMPAGGKISVSTGRGYRPTADSAEESQQNEQAILKVTDSGIGISPKDIDRIFEPFYTKKTLGRSGTGLGMAVVWGTMKDHHGHIDVHSVPGEGTTFTLYFPTTTEKIIPPRLASPLDKLMGKGESILVVDDVEEQREIVLKMLQELGYAARSISSGEEAVACLQKESFDLLILDMFMEPGMDGLETYRKILKHNPRQKAILTSGYAETRRIKAAQKLGAGGFLRKPFFLTDLGSAVRLELDKEIRSSVTN